MNTFLILYKYMPVITEFKFRTLTIDKGSCFVLFFCFGPREKRNMEIKPLVLINY